VEGVVECVTLHLTATDLADWHGLYPDTGMGVDQSVPDDCGEAEQPGWLTAKHCPEPVPPAVPKEVLIQVDCLIYG
jgi:hypothetical protein